MAEGSEFEGVRLSPKERKFMVAFFRTSNKTRAYLEACPGVTEESAGTLGAPPMRFRTL